MNKVAQRFLVFTIGVPAVGATVLLLPQYDHLALNIVIIVFSAIGAGEFSVMLSGKNLFVPKPEAAILGALLPAAAVLSVVFGLDSPVAFVASAATLGFSWLIVSRVFSGGERLDGFANGVVAGLSVMLYPGLLMAWLAGMTGWENSGVVIVTFLIAVFGGDSLAWATGMMFGKGNRGIVPASPNKSVAGFVGGVLGPVIVGIGAVMIRPDVFVPGPTSPLASPVVAGAVLGLLTGCAAIIGDLCESAFKRSSGVKDSGSFILGRGGVLDSIDSVALAAPVFYLCFRVLFAA